jgi:hypothetical protein
MNPQVLKDQFIYNDCPIAIRRTGERFEFITCINFSIYSSFIVAKKSLLQRLFFRDYSKKQIQDITNYVIAMAQATINQVLSIESPTKT